MMSKTLLIFHHEFMTTLKRTGFIIMTLAVPVLALLAIGISLLISGIVRPGPVEIISIGYIDQEGGFNQFTTQGKTNLVSYSAPESAIQDMVKGDIKEYFVIPQDYSSTEASKSLYAGKQPAPPGDNGSDQKFPHNQHAGRKVSPASINVIESPLNLVTTRITSTGAVASEQGGYGNLIIPSIFSFLLVLSLSFSSAYLIQGLGEEKENRLIEVLLSSVSTRQLLIGKVLGLGAAGLIQVLVWLISLPLLLTLLLRLSAAFSALSK
jgi:ABC-2 type transport system permease protein